MNNEYVLFQLRHSHITSSEGVFVWFPDQVRDDNYRQPGLKEGAFIIHNAQFIMHNS